MKHYWGRQSLELLVNKIALFERVTSGWITIKRLTIPALLQTGLGQPHYFNKKCWLVYNVMQFSVKKTSFFRIFDLFCLKYKSPFFALFYLFLIKVACSTPGVCWKRHRVICSFVCCHSKTEPQSRHYGIVYFLCSTGKKTHTCRVRKQKELFFYKEWLCSVQCKADCLSDLAGEDVLWSGDQHSGCGKSKGVQWDTKRGKNKINFFLLFSFKSQI